ncbi:flagellar basal-body rod protein FlgF [Rhodomicrobium lacus]|uniref:flagellar basal-body rod protein FlgF n=1 Tax=Rhodomicrobium lacus TaxID=2498452 RepID=UPI000F8F029B|nr:flagellar basal-body rod protein FlgF [Rhodomicrobium lacus]
MQSSLYVALSAQVALQKRLDTVAQNVANANTVGYRGTEMKFDSVLSAADAQMTAFVTSKDSVVSLGAGGLVKTGNPLDVALKGQGWLSVQTPAGRMYTRDGRMQMTTSGMLVSMRGDPVLDAGGAPLQVDPNGPTPQIAEDGTITQNNERIGMIGVFVFGSDAKLSRVEGGFVSDKPAIAATDPAKSNIASGYVEESNVNAIKETARLIYVQRAFDEAASTIQSVESGLKSAIQALGSPTS